CRGSGAAPSSRSPPERLKAPPPHWCFPTIRCAPGSKRNRCCRPLPLERRAHLCPMFLLRRRCSSFSSFLSITRLSKIAMRSAVACMRTHCDELEVITLADDTSLPFGLEFLLGPSCLYLP